MIEKILFVYRYWLAKLIYRDQLKTGGFFFIEKDVVFHLSRGGRMHIGKGVYIRKGTVLECGPKGVIEIGEKSVLGYYAWIGSLNRVTVGKNCLIGSKVDIMDSKHKMEKGSPIRDQGYVCGKTVIGDDCLIGTKTSVFLNVAVGTGTIIGSNSVVLNNLPENVVAAGIPARIIKDRV